MEAVEAVEAVGETKHTTQRTPNTAKCTCQKQPALVWLVATNLNHDITICKELVEKRLGFLVLVRSKMLGMK